jgi:hypothetical protein
VAVSPPTEFPSRPLAIEFNGQFIANMSVAEEKEFRVDATVANERDKAVFCLDNGYRHSKDWTIKHATAKPSVDKVFPVCWWKNADMTQKVQFTEGTTYISASSASKLVMRSATRTRFES